MQTQRLDAVISLIRHGSRLADIGCDHAYVSTEAIRLGICRYAMASDVRERPLARAKENIAACGFSDRITTLLTDGLDGIEAFSPTDIVIAGMGGDLISSILGKSEYIHRPEINLILQPMTAVYELRAYLHKNGFEIVRELLCDEDDRIYRIILAHFTGAYFEPTEAELHLGVYNLTRCENPELLLRLIDKTIKKYNTIYSGKLRASLDTTYERSLLFTLQKIREGMAKNCTEATIC